MILVKFATTGSNNVKRQIETRYHYKSSSSQFPEKCVIPSGNEFEFLRDDHNEELFGIVTPKRQKHVFQLIPLMGKTLFYYRPPWITYNEKSYYFVFNDVTANLMDETFLFPNGDSIFTTNQKITACWHDNSFNSLSKCHKIKINSTTKGSETVTEYDIEDNKKVSS